ncbi:MAG: hypothetical protein OJJ54_20380 [Pseudonocardia sp.]|nr:hypothetical protein [Pseudonocardia sp.]
MVWLFGQVWLLLVVAFLLGAALTWVAFVAPARRAARRAPVAEWTPPSWTPAAGPPSVPVAPGPPRDAVAEPPRIPAPADSALAELDQRRNAARRRSAGAAAAGAIDSLTSGTGASIPRQQGPEEPT